MDVLLLCVSLMLSACGGNAGSDGAEETQTPDFDYEPSATPTPDYDYNATIDYYLVTDPEGLPVESGCRLTFDPAAPAARRLLVAALLLGVL